MSLEVIKRSNTGFFAATVMPGFLDFLDPSYNIFNLKVIRGRYRSLEVIRRSHNK